MSRIWDAQLAEDNLLDKTLTNFKAVRSYFLIDILFYITIIIHNDQWSFYQAISSLNYFLSLSS